MELFNSKTTQLTPRRFAVDCSLSPMQMRPAGEGWQDIVPAISRAGNTWEVAGTPYRFELQGNGARRIYPYRDDASKYLSLPMVPLLRNLPWTIQGRRLVANLANYDIYFSMENSGLRFGVVFRQAPPWDRITLDIDAIGGLDVLNLLRATGGLGIPRPRLVELGRLDPVERPISWNYANGQLTVGLDFSGLRFPVAFRNVTVDLQVGASTDDADQFATTRALTGTVIVYGEWANLRRAVGARFASAGLPSGATITTTYAEWYKNVTQSITVYGKVYFDDQANSPTFSSTSGPRDRTPTTAKVDMDLTNPQNATWYGSAFELKTCVQELVDSYGAIDNLSVVVDDDSASPAWNNSFQWDSYDGAPSTAPKLHVEYTAGGVAFNLERLERHYIRGVMRGGLRGVA